MKRCRNRQWQCAFGTVGLQPLAGLFDCSFAAGNDSLHRVIEVDGFCNLTAVGAETGRHFNATGNDLGGFHSQDSSHGTGAHRNGALHGVGTKPHQRRGLPQRQHAGSDQRRVLTQRMTCHHRRQCAALGQPDAPRSDTRHQHHRLRIGRQRQRFLRPLMDQPGQIFIQSIRRLRQRFHNDRMIAPGIQHADGLRALTGKDKSK